MDILFFYPRWGSSHIDWNVFLNQVKQDGYDGVEIGLPEDQKDQDTVFSLPERLNLKYIIQHYETLTPNFTNHLEEFTRRLDTLRLICNIRHRIKPDWPTNTN
jgi:hypothetical protein